jgi:hypothetical protein
MIRVIQWATGSVGSAQLREVIDRPDLELVGLYLYGQSKLDIDAGVLVGRPPTGVAATDDASATARTRPPPPRRRWPTDKRLTISHANVILAIEMSSRLRI